MTLNVKLENLENGFLITSFLDETSTKNETYIEHKEFLEGGYFIAKRDRLTMYRICIDKDFVSVAYGGNTEEKAMKKAREVAGMIIHDAGFDRYRDLTDGNDREVLVAENLTEDNGKGILRS